MQVPLSEDLKEGLSEARLCAQITPVGDRVCVKVAKAETKTAGGILLPTDAQRKPTSGAPRQRAVRCAADVKKGIAAAARAAPVLTRHVARAAWHLLRCPGDVVSVGDKTSALKAGDTVVYSKFGIGVTDLEIKGEEYAVLKEEDIIGTFPASGATTGLRRAARAQPHSRAADTDHTSPPPWLPRQAPPQLTLAA